MKTLAMALLTLSMSTTTNAAETKSEKLTDVTEQLITKSMKNVHSSINQQVKTDLNTAVNNFYLSSIKSMAEQTKKPFEPQITLSVIKRK